MLRSIRARILALFLLSVAAFTGAMGYGLSQLSTIGEGLTAINEAYLPLAGYSATLEEARRQMDAEHDSLLREDPLSSARLRSSAASYSRSIRDSAAQARVQAAQAGALAVHPSDRQALADIQASLAEIERLNAAHDQAFEAWKATPDPAGSAAAKAELLKRRTELRSRLGQPTARIERQIEEVSKRTARARDRAYAVSVALAALAILFAGVLAWVALVTLRPMATLTEQVQRLAAGDYAGPPPAGLEGAGEEVAVLAREFNAMAAAVAERDRRLSERAAALDELSLRLRRILDTIRAGLVVVERGAVAVVNPAAEALWGLAVGAPLPPWMSALAPGRHEALSLDNRRFDVEVVPFGARGVLVVGEDVTQRLADRERLARAERLALVGQMLAQITHEVRNPLNAMSLNAELLAEEIQEEEAQEMLATITGEIRRLEQLTARYLALSRRRTPELVHEDPVSMAREVVRLEEEALRRAGVAAQVRGEPGALVELDGDALRRALRNVLLNAVEAGATEILIDVQRAARELVLAVSDNGPGMEESQAKQAFDPFYTTKSRGTGLGLAISRQELEEVGGQLRCESIPGRGSTFYLLSPLPAADG